MQKTETVAFQWGAFLLVACYLIWLPAQSNAQDHSWGDDFNSSLQNAYALYCDADTTDAKIEVVNLRDVLGMSAHSRNDVKLTHVSDVILGNDSSIAIEIYKGECQINGMGCRYLAVDSLMRVYRMKGWNHLDVDTLYKMTGLYYYASIGDPVDTIGVVSLIHLAIALGYSDSYSDLGATEVMRRVPLVDTIYETCTGPLSVSSPSVAWANMPREFMRPDFLLSVVFYTVLVLPHWHKGPEIEVHELLFLTDSTFELRTVDLTNRCRF